MLLEQKEILNTEGTIEYIESIYDSANVLSSMYFPNTNELYISYLRGGTYSYGNISEDFFKRLQYADSQGKFVRAELQSKPKEYPYRKEFLLYKSEVQALNERVETKRKEISEAKTQAAINEATRNQIDGQL